MKATGSLMTGNAGFMLGTYVPYMPYVFKSGKHQGQNLESLMFKNYSFVAFLLSQVNKNDVANPNEMHRHLTWLISAGENRQTILTCPFCQEKKATHFLANYALDSRLVCCDDPACRGRLKQWNGQILPFKFSSLKYFSRIGKTAYDQAQSFLKKSFGLPPVLTPERILEFFKA